MRNLITFLLLAISLLTGEWCFSVNYYIAANGNNSNSGTSSGSPWLTMAKVQSMGGTITATDSVLFRRGDIFTGQIYWTTGGVIFGAYGTGLKPRFLYTNPTSTPLIDRAEWYVENADNVTFQDLEFTDTAIANDPAKIADKDMFAHEGYGINTFNSNHPIIKRCKFIYIGMGIAVEYGDYAIITNDSFINLKNMVSDGAADNDFGANGITVNHSSNDSIASSYFNGNYATSVDYGFNGGACEQFHSTNNNKFMYNYVIDCCGVSEFGSDTIAHSQDNLFAYNIIINCGLLWYFQTGGGNFAMQLYNTMIYNNAIVQNSTSVFASEPSCLYYSPAGGEPLSDSPYVLKNNIFLLSNGTDVKRASNSSAKYVHENNIYQLSGGSVTNYTLNGSELSTNSPVWVSTSGTNPNNWNYHLITGSAGIGFGQNLGFTKDYAGNNVSNPPDAGVYQYVTTTPCNCFKTRKKYVNKP